MGRCLHRTTLQGKALCRVTRPKASRDDISPSRFVDKHELVSPKLKLLQFNTNKELIMRNFSGKAPTFVVWVISLVLFIVALLAQFGVVRMGAPIATWSWIIGFGLLLIACRVKGL